MPLIAHALFYFAYALIASAIASAMLRFLGAEALQAILVGLGAFVVAAVAHAAAAVSSAHKQLDSSEDRLLAEIEKVRLSQRRLEGQVGQLAGRVEEMDQAFTEAVVRQASLPPPPSPVQLENRIVEQLAAKLGHAVDSRIEDLRRALPLAGPAIPRRPADMVREALLEGRAELYLQPIVTLPQRRTAFYEAFTRLKDDTGRLILPDEFMAPAEAAGLMPQIDNLLLFRCVQIVRRLLQKDRRIGVFCNLSMRSLSDEQFFPGFLEFMAENRDLAGAMIFELPKAAFEARTPAQARAMGRLIDLGFFLSLDRVDSLALDLRDLERAAVRYVKMEGELLRRQLADEHVRPLTNIARDVAAPDVAAVFRRHNVELIAERIERETTVVELLELDVALAQGNLFGAARPIKDKLMAETAPPPGFLRDREAG